MRACDVRVLAATVAFHAVQLDQPLSISGRAIAWFTMAEVELQVADRSGRRGSGRGATILSVPWAWPVAAIDIEDRDRALRELTEELAAATVASGPADPIEHWRVLYGDLDTRLHRLASRYGVAQVPRLAGLLALGAVDSAVHDAWAMTAGRPASTMYDAAHLGSDLGWFDPALAGRYPGEFLGRGRRRLPVQHVVGVSDPLTAAEAGAEARPLTDWLRTEGVHHLKVKVSGDRPEQDAQRVVDVARLGLAEAGQVAVAVDPNEGCADASAALHLVDEIDRIAPEVTPLLRYLEQPVPRDAPAEPEAMARLGDRLPVLLDEGFSDLSMLPQLRDQGWSGVVIKAAKGHSLALLTHAYARCHRLWVAVQDLTALSWALVHSARLVSTFELSAPHLEYNSRQYAPRAAQELLSTLPELAHVRDGQVHLPSSSGPGLYELPSSTTVNGAG
ncbi:mandelate racemase/muconate lactonizing enzyme family protein [Ruania zhangjianzhongii]|uniref:mandelate racemase/muconate lactonizing enzyme family protein n=1 Tax=Ruania zhangjianzhongii TaxID=2603206 RepID=UPI0011C85EDD|nr:mandelate racemase/muconate lactonizing enzyme family protein [Ruania zhangjianzhongii]